ncbi:hypothetical protein ACFYWY_11120 [Streptomyces sp. NPDC002870]|uniref:hypothetical protein n=1 Tax=Streptomyces sp. NPDC002870 TaxID=3364666 RepID=UPI0036CAE75C
MSTEAERRFHTDMVAGVDRLKREIGYNATRFAQMLGGLGGVAAARQLLRGHDASDGFTTLWEHDRLDVSVEAYVLLPWYRGLFDEHHLETAMWRLTEHRFDVDRFLDEARENPPGWTQANTDADCGDAAD